MSKQIFTNFILNNKDIIKITDNGLEIKLKNKYIPLTWVNAKKNITFLKEYNNFRKEYVNTLLDEVINEIKCKPECYYIAAGSSSIDSDYDITLYSRFSSRIVDMFNDKFITRFKKRSNIVFDTNLYGASFFHTSVTNNYDYIIKDKKKGCSPGNFIYYIKLEDNIIDIKNQHIWALVKLLMQINKIKNNKLKDIIYEYIKKFKYLRKDIEIADNKLNKLKKEKTNYSKQLIKYNNLKNIFDTSYERNINTIISLKDQISKTNFYGVETYFTQGAVNHVVGKLQLNFKNLKLSEHEYIDSLIENLGDIIKEYSHYPLDYHKFTTHASKYMIRVADAVININTGDLYAKKIINISRKLRKLRGTNKLDLINKELDKLQRLLKYKNKTNIDLLSFFIEYFLNIIDRHYKDNNKLFT